MYANIANVNKIKLNNKKLVTRELIN